MIISLFQTILQYFFYYIGLAHTTGVKAAIIVGANVFIAILVSSLLYKLEKAHRCENSRLYTWFFGDNHYKSWGTFGGKLQFSRGRIYFSLHLCIRFFIGVYEALFRNRRPCYASGWQFVFGGAVLTVIGFLMGGRPRSHECKGFSHAFCILPLYQRRHIRCGQCF